MLILVNTFCFVLMAWLVMNESHAIRLIDNGVTRLVRGQVSERKTHLALSITHLGDFGFLLILSFIVGVGLVIIRRYLVASTFILGFLGARLMCDLLKALIGRERPTLNAFIKVGQASFPSGHTMQSLYFYGALSLMLIYFLYQNGSLSKSGLALIPGFVVVILIGWSRVYLGVHYPSDIIGGFFSGLAWLGVVVFFYAKKVRTPYIPLK